MVYGVYNDLLVITWNGCVSYHLLVNSASFFFYRLSPRLEMPASVPTTRTAAGVR